MSLRRYIVINAKGGSGKTTVATNLAACFAGQGFRTALFDYDPQYSSLAWLKARRSEAAPIFGVAAHEPARAPMGGAWQLRVPRETERVVIDTAAGLRAADLAGRIQPTDTLLIPIQPSAMDVRATADFIRDLMLVGKVRVQNGRVGIIVNRVRRAGNALESLHRFLETLNVPVVAELRDSPHYLDAIEQGAGIVESTEPEAAEDQACWKKIIDWAQPAAEAQPTPVRPTTGGNIRPVVPMSGRAWAPAQSQSSASEGPVQHELPIPAFLTYDGETRH